MVPPIIVINYKKCVGCAYCVMVCPTGGFRAEVISKFLHKCNKCGKCINNCPVSAIKAQWEGK